jgi:ATP-binding cassette subfamily F protein 3
MRAARLLWASVLDAFDAPAHAMRLHVRTAHENTSDLEPWTNLLRATTDQFLIVANGRLQEFDGDLDDYRDWLLKKTPAPKVVKVKEKKSIRKPNEQRVKRLEDLMARLNAQKASIEQKLAAPAVYQEAAALSALLTDQAYVAKELEQVEAEWLELAK